MTRHTFVRIMAALTVCLAAGQQLFAGNYTVYSINMAQLNYKTPVPYNKVIRTGLTNSVFTSSQNCLNSIKSRVNQNKKYGTDYECFLVIYTDKYPTTPASTEVGTLAHVNSGAYGKWAGWIIYWAPARNKGYYLNPYQNFKPYGRTAAAATRDHKTGKSPGTVALQAPAAQAGKQD